MKVIIILLIVIFVLYRKIRNPKEVESGNVIDSDSSVSQDFETDELSFEDKKMEFDSVVVKQAKVETYEEKEQVSVEENDRKFSLRDAVIYSAILDRARATLVDLTTRKEGVWHNSIAKTKRDTLLGAPFSFWHGAPKKISPNF